MYFDSIEAVLAMDGHGAFVWSAYAITVVVIVAILIAPVLRHRRLLRQVSGEVRRGGDAVSRQRPGEVT